jgi:hypothetical protein
VGLTKGLGDVVVGLRFFDAAGAFEGAFEEGLAEGALGFF